MSTPLKSIKSNELYTNFSNGLKSFKDLALNNEHEGLTSQKSKIRSIKSHQEINPLIKQTDDELLAQIGYKPELKRQFSTIQVFGVAFSIMGLLPSIASVIGQSFTTGSSSAIWGWFISGGLILLIGICMSELASSIPTSGGLYYWTYHYAPENWKIPLSFLVGNSNTVALTGALCSIDYGFAKEVLSIVYISKDGDFEITDAMTYGVYCACILSHILVTCLASKNIASLQSFSIVSNVLLIIFFIIVILVGTGTSSSHHFNNASFIFGNLETSLSDWSSGWSWIMNGMLPCIWTIGAFDSCVHMSEEAKNSSRSVPRGILGSITACWLLGWIILIVCGAVINPDLSSVIDSESGQPMAEIIYHSLGKKWSISFMSLIASCQWLMGASTITATSRQIWAFARDNGLIFSQFVKVVNKKLSVPIRAIWFNGVLAIIMGTLCLIGPTAANALFTLYICGNYFAWEIPIMLRIYRSFGPVDSIYKFKPGLFYMGPRLSPIINWITIFFTNFVIIMAMFPTSPHVDKENMNYTVVITMSTWILSMIYYYSYAKKTYFGPRNTLDEQEQDSDDYIEGNEMLNIDDIIEDKKE
ncbi:GABA-specific permease [Wickerhamomyces ciferrii]|uniref:GABA-specific permease n=1 Tax=Wickerhamomyces ciferrii (strain ATCC 14091 / BCRC 22168 / CBS 111 / JCM 3599 / NBRC 0793 / NRRL Y-1031 F-60-10) TaxID=1206466 RepID=K0KPP9_WICCF|nr:GABA-specific permease [Wickerhamomyces ciferrii]CCH44981.1 GABA-specific permease [Wickerhamomyces ciferrii]